MYLKKARLTVFIAILLLLSMPYFQTYALAQEKISMADRIISSTFKNLAKAFVATTDINNFKKCNIDKLNKMDEKKFRKQYAKAYKVIKDLPPALKGSFRITEDMNKEQVIKNIESLDKKKMYKTIDSIPDTIIAGQFRQYLNEKKQEIQKSNVVEQINMVWNTIIKKVSPSNLLSVPH